MVLDIITLILVALGFYQGFSKGLVKTIFAILSLIVAVVASLKLSPIVISFLQSILPFDPAISFILGFVLTFILVFALISFIGHKIDQLLSDLNIGIINKLLGGGLLALIYAVLLSYCVYFLDRTEILSENQKQKSITYPVLRELPEATQNIVRKLKPVFSEFWDVMLESMDDIRDKAEEEN